jgi:hypothetical protein
VTTGQESSSARRKIPAREKIIPSYDVPLKGDYTYVRYGQMGSEVLTVPLMYVRLRAPDATDQSDPSRLVPGPPLEAHRARGTCGYDQRRAG